MANIKTNKNTNTEYEFIQYNNNFKEVKQFIKENYNLVVSMVTENIEILGLETEGLESVIKKGDFIVRTTSKYPLYSVLDEKLFNEIFI